MVILVGNANDNTLLGGIAADILQGYAGNDSLVGGIGQDTLHGGLGDDILLGGRGADRLIGGGGADTFRYAEVLDLAGDTIIGFAVGDRIDLSATGLSFMPFGFSGQGSEFVITVDPADAQLWRIGVDRDGDGIGEFGTTVVLAAAGGVLAQGSAGVIELVLPQSIAGGAENETIPGAANRDTITGAGGNDSLAGGAGDDSLDGGTGNDTLVGGMGKDTMVGGSGADRFVWGAPEDLGTDFVNDLDALDILDLSALLNLTFVGSAAFSGDGGELRFERGSSLSLSRIFIDIDGDGAQDATIWLPGAKAIEPLVAGSRQFRLVPDLVILGDTIGDRLSGRGGDDSIDGVGGNDQIAGNAGNDTLLGGLGNDAIAGGEGNDSLVGGLGFDTLTGGGGIDVLVGGPNNDVFRFLSLNDLPEGSVSDVIEDPGIGDRVDLSAIAGLSWIGTAAFSDVAGQVRIDDALDRLQIDADGDGISDRMVVLGGAGTVLAPIAPGSLVLQVVGPFNTLLGATNDTFSGSLGGDTIRGNSGNDSLVGNDGRDSLLGMIGDDTLRGGDDNDTLQGGAGRDLLDGGLEQDRYIFASLGELGLGATADTVVMGSGDVLDFRLIDWSAAAGDQAFTRIADASIFTAAGQLRVAPGTIQINTDADAAPEYEVLGIFVALQPGQILL
jgi:Ca2+-binding RTX toxin-like protein